MTSAVVSNYPKERPKKLHRDTARLAAATIAPWETVAHPTTNNKVASTVNRPNSRAPNRVERADNTREVCDIGRKRVVNTGANKSYPGRPTTTSTTYTSDKAENTHTKIRKLTYYNETSPNNSAATKTPARDRSEAGIDSTSRPPAHIVANSTKEVPREARMSVEESYPSIRPSRRHIVVDRTATVLNWSYDTATPTSNRVRVNRNRSSTSSEAPRKSVGTKHSEAWSGRGIYAPKSAEEVTAGPRNYGVIAYIDIRNPKGSLNWAVVEESTTRRHMSEPNYVEPYNYTADNPSSPVPGKYIRPDTMSEADTKEGRNLVDVYRSIAPSPDSRKTVETELSSGPSGARRGSGNTKVAVPRYPPYTPKSAHSKSDPSVKVDNTTCYSVAVVARETPKPTPNKEANIAKSNMVTAVHDLVVVASTWKIGDNSTAVGSYYSGSASTKNSPATRLRTSGENSAKSWTRSTVTGRVSSSSYPDVVEGYKRVPEGSTRP